MKPLKLILISMSALALAAPAAIAQTQPADTAASSNHRDWTLKEREDWLYHRLDQARDDGSIDSNEYRHVGDELADVQAQENSLRSRHDGGQLTDSENASLEGRLDYIGDRIHWLRATNLDRPW
ncbi:hypothetical protein [Phenylobacterium montanum]|uniref:Uncharacterized protein n=1 Tax=Phenylobacterium montanum TaxID=2823693 RepID=A0A975FXW0_9CAUL|nr:hypothetical protein [Caulobacter sp. S6]QUD86947.1 hypothetical protein KCG34_17990 [Caulobacter sp. S6]